MLVFQAGRAIAFDLVHVLDGIPANYHRLCAVEAWVEAHRQILELSTGWSIGKKDISDDKLARVVEAIR